MSFPAPPEPTTIWLSIDEHTQIGVDRDKAFEMSERGFYKLYRKTVYGHGRKHRQAAKAWAKRQVEERDEALYLDWYLGATS